MEFQHSTPPPDPCIWMQAGVVKTKMCRRAFDCTGCRFDRVLRRLAEENRERSASGAAVPGRRGRIVYWADKLNGLPAHRRPCLHHLKGRIDFRNCTHDYLCSNCEFDQSIFTGGIRGWEWRPAAGCASGSTPLQPGCWGRWTGSTCR
ncbi:MAG: hypothetical protein HGJ93_01415 [Desulfosarcina sp.]|nr:hypothetical protein [Desulfosarcina sp.]MBC2764641.1 hypothetical protein [Desulfosarcina sp.]